MNIDFTDVMDCLIIGDLDNAYKNLSIYMKNINKSEYEFLIVDLIKIGILENDKSYSKACAVLNFIGMGFFNFNIEDYVNYFNQSLLDKKYQEARIYLDIIVSANGVIDKKIVINNLINALEKADGVSYKEIIKKKVRKENKLLEEKIKYLRENKGLVVLDPMVKKERSEIYDYVKDYDDIAMFSVGVEPDKRPVLKYREKYKTTEELKEALRLGEKAYENKDWEEAIKHFLVIVNYGKVSAYLVANLGLSYLRIGMKDTALKYLIIANCMNKEYGNKHCLDGLIARLQGDIEDEDKKSYVRVEEEEFEEKDININNFDEINSYIISSGLDVRSACINLGLDEDEIGRVLLVYAKEYYTCGMYEVGDQFLKAFEKSKSKNIENRRLFNEIVKDKKFYINRTRKNKNMSLILKP